MKIFLFSIFKNTAVKVILICIYSIQHAIWYPGPLSKPQYENSVRNADMKFVGRLFNKFLHNRLVFYKVENLGNNLLAGQSKTQNT